MDVFVIIESNEILQHLTVYLFDAKRLLKVSVSLIQQLLYSTFWKYNYFRNTSLQIEI